MSLTITRARSAAMIPTTPARPNDTPQVRCSGHKKVCRRTMAGPTSKNPGRAFYACPLGKNHPDRCRYFKWLDELDTEEMVAGSSSRSSRGRGTERERLGGTNLSPGGGTLRLYPRARNGGPAGLEMTENSPTKTPPTSTTTTPLSVQRTLTKQFTPVRRVASVTAKDNIDLESDSDSDMLLFSEVEIDWAKVDTDEIEREAALRSTPRTSHTHTATNVFPLSSIPKDSSIGDRLRAAALSVAPVIQPGKRKLDETVDTAQTPPNRHDNRNPFLATTPSNLISRAATSSSTAQHPVLSPVFGVLESLDEHLARQDRLLRAAETVKMGMRTTIFNLKEENRALVDRVKELEAIISKE